MQVLSALTKPWARQPDAAAKLLLTRFRYSATVYGASLAIQETLKNFPNYAYLLMTISKISRDYESNAADELT